MESYGYINVPNLPKSPTITDYIDLCGTCLFGTISWGRGCLYVYNWLCHRTHSSPWESPILEAAAVQDINIIPVSAITIAQLVLSVGIRQRNLAREIPAGLAEHDTEPSLMLHEASTDANAHVAQKSKEDVRLISSNGHRDTLNQHLFSPHTV